MQFLLNILCRRICMILLNQSVKLLPLLSLKQVQDTIQVVGEVLIEFILRWWRCLLLIYLWLLVGEVATKLLEGGLGRSCIPQEK